MEIAISFQAILVWAATIGYPLLKALSSYYISRQEFKYPIWNKEGVQIQRRLHHIIRAYARNFLINPEWAGIKLLAYIPVWLVSGKGLWDYFSPWRIQKTPPFCQTCNDKGEYFEEGFLKGSGAWRKCRDCSQKTRPTPHYKCEVCSDTRNIGPNRPCPHCERRAGLGEQFAVPEDYQLSTHVCINLSKAHPPRTLPYLEPCHQSQIFCGNSDHRKYCVPAATGTRYHPEQLCVGDIVVVSSITSGHGHGNMIGKYCRVLGVNLPFVVVEYSGNFTPLVRAIDVRGMTFHGNEHARNLGELKCYQPLIDPTTLQVGDKFSVLQLEKSYDCSYRGEAFHVTKAAYQTDIKVRGEKVSKKKILMQALRLGRGQHGKVTFCCENLQIIPVNDQYIQVTLDHHVI